MTKEEKIKEAYGEHYERIKDYLYADGWLDKLVFAVTDISYEDIAIQPFVNPPGTFCRPKSLEGIENNNGWIKIESEADLPKESGEYWVQNLDSDNEKEIFSCWFNKTKKEWKYKTEIENVTHYQPIEKPKPPIY